MTYLSVFKLVTFSLEFIRQQAINESSFVLFGTCELIFH